LRVTPAIAAQGPDCDAMNRERDARKEGGSRRGRRHDMLGAEHLILEPKSDNRLLSSSPWQTCTCPLAGPRLCPRPGQMAGRRLRSWMLSELIPDLRQHVIRRYPVILAVIARHVATGAVDGARDGYRTARTELGEAVPPHAVDAALTAYRDEGRRLAAAAKAAVLVERALRGEALKPACSRTVLLR